MPTDDSDTPQTQRLDKWLWYARVAKTRTLASGLVQNGKVRVNRERTGKPGHAVRVHDVITVAVHGRIRVLRVLAPGKRRGPAVEAALLFEDLSPPVVAGSSADNAAEADDAGRAGGPRPTKKERRAVDRLRSDGMS
ncbi:MAG: RNA-binding S4 domain-containing protein [Hyphomicrobiaceae bacterium]